MPTAQVLIRQQNGQTIVLAEGDRIVKEVTIPCSSQRCPSRHGQESPVTFTFNDQDPFPESGDQFLSLILPERSPSNLGYPLPFCGPQCLRDYLVYQYLAPGPRQPVQVQEPLTAEQLAAVQKTDSPDLYCVTEGNGDCVSTDPRCMHNSPAPPPMADVEASIGPHDLPEPTVLSQADGVGE